MNAAIFYLANGDNAAKWVENRVENQGLQRLRRVALGCRHALDHRLDYLVYAFAGLAAGTDNVLPRTTYKLDYLVFHLLGHGVGHVYLVDHGYDFQIVIYGHVQI